MKSDASNYLLDSHALLAFLRDERGAHWVDHLLRSAEQNEVSLQMSVINWGEVTDIVERERGVAGAQDALDVIDGLPIEILPAPRETVLAAAHIKARFPIAYADAFAVAAAQSTGATILTGDPEFELVRDIVPVEILA